MIDYYRSDCKATDENIVSYTASKYFLVVIFLSFAASPSSLERRLILENLKKLMLIFQISKFLEGPKEEYFKF